ncbi:MULTISPECIES: hypothetical protein [Streptomyces]|uniref:Uncharacterized protein n=1 Tax=Streptomyces viridochromogenes TaxID=1938 RepID=A0A0L8KT28_STRVR|nr:MULTISPECIES: hypothetical protein [Streptomyces]KOG28889.1 hypothetical protein ADK34_13570 [Streptomyces viridochromogenes]
MADQPDEASPNSSRMSDKERYEYSASILAGTEDHSHYGECVYDGWYDADGNPCTLGKYKTGANGTPIPIDPNEPPPVYRP